MAHRAAPKQIAIDSAVAIAGIRNQPASRRVFVRVMGGPFVGNNRHPMPPDADGVKHGLERAAENG